MSLFLCLLLWWWGLWESTSLSLCGQKQKNELKEDQTDVELQNLLVTLSRLDRTSVLIFIIVKKKRRTIYTKTHCPENTESKECILKQTSDSPYLIPGYPVSLWHCTALNTYIIVVFNSRCKVIVNTTLPKCDTTNTHVASNSHVKVYGSYVLGTALHYIQVGQHLTARSAQSHFIGTPTY